MSEHRCSIICRWNGRCVMEPAHWSDEYHEFARLLHEIVAASWLERLIMAAWLGLIGVCVYALAKAAGLA